MAKVFFTPCSPHIHQSHTIFTKSVLPDRESNPGLPRDRRRSSPLDYRGIVRMLRLTFLCHYAYQQYILTINHIWTPKELAPGEARTHNPGITHCTVYKYRALTDCATGAHRVIWKNIDFKTQSNLKKYSASCGVRTHAIFRLWELKSHALDHSAKLANDMKWTIMTFWLQPTVGDVAQW